MLGLAGPVAIASPTSDVLDAEAALQAGDAASALRLLRATMREPSQVKARTRALGFTLLAEALLVEATAGEGRGDPLQATRDVLLEAMAAGHAVTGEELVDDSVRDRARAAVDAARAQLWAQAFELVSGEERSRIRGWIEGLEGVEGESLESLALRAMSLAASGERNRALARFEAATRTADQPGSDVRTPMWGMTYREQARVVAASGPDSLPAAIEVLERGLAWQVRTTTSLGPDHDYPLRNVRRALESERLSLLMRLPERRTEALYALEAVLKDNVGNVALLLELAPWLEAHFPARALDAYQQAQLTTPNDPRLPRLAGLLLEGEAARTAAAMAATRDAAERQTLRLRRDGQLRDALAQLERAHELEPDDAETVAHLVAVCRQRRDAAGVKRWLRLAQELEEG